MRKKFSFIDSHIKKEIRKEINSYICAWCRKFGYDMEIHHIIPVSEGGLDSADNGVLLHKKCHEKIHQNYNKDKIKKLQKFKEDRKNVKAN